MSLKPNPIQPVPEATASVARAVFRKGNPLVSLRDEVGAILADTDFADLFPKLGKPGLPPWRLALVTLLQFRENLSDRWAAEAVRARIDWKYLLGLKLADLGFDHSVLCEFRARLLAGSAEERLLHKLLEACQTRGLLKARGRQRTDATHVVASVRALNPLELAGETCAQASGTGPGKSRVLGEDRLDKGWHRMVREDGGGDGSPGGGHRCGAWRARLGRPARPHARRARRGLRRHRHQPALHDAGGVRPRRRAAAGRGRRARCPVAGVLVAGPDRQHQVRRCSSCAPTTAARAGVLALGTLAARASATGATTCRGWSSSSRWAGWPCSTATA